MRRPYDRWFPLGTQCPESVLPGHRLRVVGVGIDGDLLRVEYRIHPAVPRTGANDWPGITWAWGAEDDAGTEYWEGAGAYGTPPGGEGTEGVLTLTPAPPPEARRLTLSLSPSLRFDDPEPPVCAIEVDLASGIAPERQPIPDAGDADAPRDSAAAGSESRPPLIDRYRGEEQSSVLRFPVDQSCPDIPPGHLLRVEAVELSEEAVWIAFSIEPPLPPSAPPPEFVAEDDRGNTYRTEESVFALSADRGRTEGLCSLPPPASRATYLAFRLVPPPISPERARRGRCDFKVAIG